MPAGPWPARPSRIPPTELKQFILTYDPTQLDLLKHDLVNLLGTKWTPTFLSKPDVAMLPVLFVILWCWTGLYLILFLANMQKIDVQIIEAARIDGASEGQVMSRVVLPSLSGVIVNAAILCIAGSLNSFALVFAMTRGGPARVTELLSIYMYDARVLRHPELSPGERDRPVHRSSQHDPHRHHEARREALRGKGVETWRNRLQNQPAKRVAGLIGKGASYVVMGVFALMTVAPLVWLIVSSFKSTTEFRLNRVGLPARLDHDQLPRRVEPRGVRQADRQLRHLHHRRDRSGSSSFPSWQGSPSRRSSPRPRRSSTAASSWASCCPSSPSWCRCSSRCRSSTSCSRDFFQDAGHPEERDR